MKTLEIIKFLVVTFILLPFSSKAQQTQIYNPSDTFFYFQYYDYYLAIKNNDTTLRYLKIRMTDQEKLSGKLYEGEYEFASFQVDKKLGKIIVTLFNKDETIVKVEKYRYTKNISIREDTWFFNLAAVTKKLKWKVIIPTIDE